MSSQELPAQQQQQQPPPPPPPPSISSDAPLPSSPTPAKTPSTNTNITTTDLTPPTPTPPQNPRLTSLHTKLSSLQTQRSASIAHATLPSGLAIPSDWTPEQQAQQALATANGVVKEHIALLHAYNEIKDVGLGLMGMVAEARGVRQKVVLEEFGIGEGD